MNLLIYLIKVLAFSGMSYSYYYYFLRNKNCHRFNQNFLFTTVLIALVAGLVKIPLQVLPNASLNNTFKILTVISRKHWEAEAGTGLGNLSTSFLPNWQWLVTATYIVITSIFIIRILRSVFRINRLSASYPFEKIGPVKFFITSESGTPFSFFNRIFWDERIDLHTKAGQQVFRHECYHVEKKHSLEILFYELITALFWFNPFFFLVKKEIRLLQEFQADQYAISGDNRHEYAQLLVEHSLQTSPIALSQYFFHHPIKRRITMITKPQNGRIPTAARILALPALLLITGAFTIRLTPKNSNPGSASAEKITILVDAGHGGVDPGAHSANGELEKDISLAIAKKIQKLSAGYPVNIVMSRDGDYLPGSAKTISEGLENRASMAARTKADLFISIHMNADDKDPVKKGAQVVVSADNRNNPYLDQSKMLGSALVASLKNIMTADEHLQQSETGVYVLDKSSCPAVIVECGYLTNASDVSFFNNDQNQELLAKKILEGALQFEKNAAK